MRDGQCRDSCAEGALLDSPTVGHFTQCLQDIEDSVDDCVSRLANASERSTRLSEASVTSPYLHPRTEREVMQRLTVRNAITQVDNPLSFHEFLYTVLALSLPSPDAARTFRKNCSYSTVSRSLFPLTCICIRICFWFRSGSR